MPFKARNCLTLSCALPCSGTARSKALLTGPAPSPGGGCMCCMRRCARSATFFAKGVVGGEAERGSAALLCTLGLSRVLLKRQRPCTQARIPLCTCVSVRVHIHSHIKCAIGYRGLQCSTLLRGFRKAMHTCVCHGKAMHTPCASRLAPIMAPDTRMVLIRGWTEH